jgi:hypothetical protein
MNPQSDRGAHKHAPRHGGLIISSPQKTDEPVEGHSAPLPQTLKSPFTGLFLFVVVMGGFEPPTCGL